MSAAASTASRLILSMSLFLLTSVASQAQPTAGCLASFNVKKKPVVLDLLPGGTSAQVASCEKAEAWREKFYIANQAVIDAAVNGTSAFYVSQMEANLAARQTAVKELEDKIAGNATKSAMVTVAKVILGEASKTEALLTCTKKPRSISCAKGVIEISLFTWDVISGDIATSRFSELVTKQKAELADQSAQVNAIKAQLATIDMKQIKADVEQTFVGMCQAIKRDCLN